MTTPARCRIERSPVKAHHPVSPLGVVSLLSTLFIGSCVDGPVAGPITKAGSHTLELVPQFGYAVATGSRSPTTAFWLFASDRPPWSW